MAVHLVRRDGQGRLRTKTFLEQIKKGKVPVTYWADEEMEFPVELGSTSWDFEETGRSSDGLSDPTSVDEICGASGADRVTRTRMY